MKRTLSIICLLIAFSFIVAACATQHKCPAYGHYTQVVSVDESSLASK